MPSDERVSIDERWKYPRLVSVRYARDDEEGLSRLHVSSECSGGVSYSKGCPLHTPTSS